MVSDKGITEDAKNAKYLIVVKTYADTAFERLEYNFSGPMKRRLTYKDPSLKILEGPFTTFSASGKVSTDGAYHDNKKDGSWYFYNDSAKAFAEYQYHLDTLKAVLDLDSLAMEKKKSMTETDTTGEREASYPGGEKKFTKFISQNLTIPKRTQSLEAGGTVRVRFIVNKNGSVTNVKISQSVEFAFDEEVLRVVSSAKDWIPAEQKGRKVNAYREQPITLSFK